MSDNNSNEIVTPKAPDQGLASQDNKFLKYIFSFIYFFKNYRFNLRFI